MTEWTMPAETAEQTRIWMAFPNAPYTLGENEEEAHAARAAWSNVANAIVDFEPVRMLVPPEAIEAAGEYLDPRVEIVEAELNDAWMRDMGPTFVHTRNGSLAAVDWIFNGWGAQAWANWDKDAQAARFIGERIGVPILRSSIVNEGGGFNVDGEGTILLTETVQLDPGRNPGASKEQIEAEFTRLLGVSTFGWLSRGLTRDYEEFGTRGHVDIVATFPSPGAVLLHWQEDPEHPDYQVCRELRAELEQMTDAAGRSLKIIELPAPRTLRDAEGFVDYSYVNHLVVNGAVIACTFDDPNDERALRVLAEAYPGRTVVGVDAREIYARGGGIHCITQQEPAPTSPRES